MQPNPTEPAYKMEVWTYEFAPDEYRAFFPLPPDDKQSYIVYQRRIINTWHTDWIAPNGVWWNLWYLEHEHELDEYTKVYLLIEIVKSGDKPP